MPDYNEVAQFQKIAEQNSDLLRKVQIVMPYRAQEGINIKLAECLSFWYAAGVKWTSLADPMGGFIECTRANIAKQFLEGDSEYLIMIDSDMEPPVALPYLLARHEAPVVGSVAMAVSAKHGPMLCLTRKDKDGNSRFVTMGHMDNGHPEDTIIPAEGLMEVDHVGTGAICIRRDVLEAFNFESGDVPFFVPEEIRIRGFKTGTLLKGEDIVFCEQVQEKGFTTHVDLEAHCGHRKAMAMKWQDSQRDPELDPESWVAPSHGMIIGGTQEA